MLRLATLRIALRALRRNTLRTLLTMLGIIIGVGAVIAMVSIGNGAKAQMEARVASLGQNVIQIFSGASTRGGFRGGFGSSGTLTREGYDAIRCEAPGGVGAGRGAVDSLPERNAASESRQHVPLHYDADRRLRNPRRCPTTNHQPAAAT